VRALVANKPLSQAQLYDDATVTRALHDMKIKMPERASYFAFILSQEGLGWALLEGLYHPAETAP
jgi:hypothetical protein